MRINVDGRCRGVEEGAPARAAPVVRLAEASAEPLGIDAGIDPAKQATRLGREAAVVRFGQAHGAGARRAQALHDALGMATQPPLLEAMGQRQLAGARRRQRRQQLGIDEAIDERARRCKVADARQFGTRIFEKPET